MDLSPQTDLYFIRHGIAAERGTYDHDGDRPLTEKGRTRTQQVAQRLKSLGCEVDCILSSPLVRAQQTTEILLNQGLSTTSKIVEDLAPAGHLQTWLSWLADWQRQHPQSRLALVGHEPNLSDWAQVLVTGQVSDRWILKKAGVIGVQVPAAAEAIAQSHLFWLTPPRLML
ncbi:MAG: phosphohistidine phosphatase SixA [Leptolyngbya sp. SIO1D8]|nr:phosphohistidine phosphatase SixA [Leptolyngbya sp. SIO1D8]